MEWLFLLFLTPAGWVILAILALVIFAIFSEFGDLIGKIIIFAYCVWLMMLTLGGIYAFYTAIHELFANGDVWEFIKNLALTLLLGFMLYWSVKFGLHTWGWILKEIFATK